MKKVNITRDFKEITKYTLNFGEEKMVAIVYEKENKFEIGSKLYDENGDVYASDYTSARLKNENHLLKILHNIYDKNKSVLVEDLTHHDALGGLKSGTCSVCGMEDIWELNSFCTRCGTKLKW